MKKIVGVIASLAMVVTLVPQASALSVIAPNQGQLIGVCWNNAVQLYWGSHPNANSNGLQKGDMHPNDPNRFWDWLPTNNSQRSYVDYNVVPGVTYSYRVKYRPELPSNVVNVTCPVFSPTPYPTPPPPPTPYPTPDPTPYPYPTLTCAPRYTTVDSGQWVTFSAHRNWQYSGNYPYYQLTWRAVGGSPSSGTGNTFGTRFYTNSIHETRNVTVSDGYRTATCTVYVRGEQPKSELRLTPVSRTINDGDSISFYATGGTGTYSWRATNTVPYTATGSSWTLRFRNDSAYTQQHTVTVTSGTQSRTANVWVRPRPYYTPTPTPTPYHSLECYPADVWAVSGEEILLRAWGGNGSYRWSHGYSYTNNDGYGAHFSVRFYNTNTHTRTFNVNVTSGYETRTCRVHVSAAPIPTPTPYGTSTPTPYSTSTPTPYGTDRLDLNQNARNVSDGHIALTSSVHADGNETVQFVLTLRNTWDTTAYNVRLTDLLPHGLSYIWGSTNVDGAVVSDELTTTGLNLGTLAPGEGKTIRFSAMVDSAVVPSWGTRTLYNTAQVRTDDSGVEVARLAIVLGNSGVLGAAAGVNTGTEDSLLIALAVALAVTGLYAISLGSIRFGRAKVPMLSDKKELNFAPRNS